MQELEKEISTFGQHLEARIKAAQAKLKAAKQGLEAAKKLSKVRSCYGAGKNV